MSISTTSAAGHGPDYDAAHGAHASGHVDANTGHHDPHLAHHFDTPEQQFTTGKLGMWTFLATEILMFGGLFCAYAVYRYNHPQVYLWAHNALNPFWGMVNTIVLLASSFTMAWGVRAAQLNQRSLLMVMLVLTFMGGVVFMCVKSVEYKEKWEYFLFPGRFNSLNAEFKPGGDRSAAEDRAETIKHVESHMGGGEHGGTAAHGESEGLNGEQQNHEGNHSTVTNTETLGASRGPASPHPGNNAPNPASVDHPQVASGMNVQQTATSQPIAMADSVVAFQQFQHDGHAGTPDAATIEPPTFSAAGINPAADKRPEHVWTKYGQLEPTDRAQLNTFFSIYFMMTGLHGIHVLVGMGLIAWLFMRSWRGDFSSSYFTPVDLGGLYWHLVDLIWIFLFPLLYLIH